MSNNKEFESIDELFRKTFNDLPESPASSGWDVPSDRVWQTVQTGIQTRHVGWSMTRKMIALAAISVVVATGVFLAMNTNNTTQQVPAPQPTILEQPQQPNHTAAISSSATTTTVKPITSVADPASRVSNTKAIAPKAGVNSVEKAAITTPKVVAAIPELPTPIVLEPTPALETPIENTSKIDKSRSTAPKPPNSVEKRKLIEQMKAAWNTPLQTIPYIKGYTAPQIPAQVRNMRATQPTTPGEE